MTGNVPFMPPTSMSMPQQAFEAMIAVNGQRVSWLRGHTCPCVFGGAGGNGRLPQLGSPQRNCTKCFGIGTYWDQPTTPMRAYVSFMHMAPTPDEPGVRVNESFGIWQSAEPSLTLPYWNPTLAANDPAQPTLAWQNASVDDQFVMIDMTSRFTAVLQVGTKEVLPYQENLIVAPSGAVTLWNPTTGDVIPAASGYTVSGATVTVSGYPAGTNYMVEFTAAPAYVIFRAAGGLPHVRPFGGGTVNEPRRWRLQALDYWTRLRSQQSTVGPGSRSGGQTLPYASAIGQTVGP